jgi:GNAT superfamily N-acetyltransferase
MTDVRVRHSTNHAADAEQLADVLIDVVEGGASVGFMLPLPRERALAFWRGCQSAAERGERILLVAEDLPTGKIVGTVQVIPAGADNQRHRADIAKMQVVGAARRRGIGAALMRAAEAAALELGRTVLVLDTVTGSDAERLYRSLGWVRVGEIPDYALFPDGRFCSTTYFYRKLA